MGEYNAVGPAAIASATAPPATALQRQASGLVNAVTDGLPERGETAAPLLMCNSLAAGAGRGPELASGRSSRRMRIAKQVGPLRQVDPMGEGIRVAVLFF